MGALGAIGGGVGISEATKGASPAQDQTGSVFTGGSGQPGNVGSTLERALRKERLAKGEKKRKRKSGGEIFRDILTSQI